MLGLVVLIVIFVCEIIMRCISACLTPTLETNMCLVKANSSRGCLAIYVFSIFLSVLVLISSITALVLFSVELGVIPSIVLGMSVLVALFFLATSFYHIVNRKRHIQIESPQNESPSHDALVHVANDPILEDSVGALQCENQQIQELEREHVHVSTRIPDLDSEVLRHEENQIRESSFEARIQELEEALASSESQFRERVVCLESQLAELAQQKSEIERSALLFEGTLQQRDRNHHLIVKSQEELRVKLERERDDLRVRCLELEAKVVQLEVVSERLSGLSEDHAHCESTITGLRQSQRESKDNIRKLKEKMRRKEEEYLANITASQERQRRYEEEISQLQQNTSENLARIRGLEHELENSAKEQTSRVQSFVEERGKYEQEIEELKRKCRDFANRVSDLQAGNTASAVQGDDLVEISQPLQEEVEARIADLQKDNREKQNKILDLESQITRFSNQIIRMRNVSKGQIEHQINKRKKVELELTASKSKSKELAAQVQRLQNATGVNVSNLQQEVQTLNQQIRENRATIRELEMSNERLRETVVTYTNERSLKLQSDPQRLRSIAKLEEARKDIRTKMSFDARERVSMARHRIRRMEELSKDSALESQVQELVEASERSISYQRIFELESQLFNLFRTHDSAPGRNHVDNLRAMRLQQYCDGDEELEAKVRNFNFPPNAPIDSSALYELEQEVFDLREDKLFVLRENLEEANERITTLETKIHELTEALRSHTEIVSPESLETRSLAEQQRLQQTNDDLRRQLDEAHVQLEDYKNRFSDLQKQLVEASREVQSKDLALSVAQNQLRQFEERR